jgi:hypothetical protein
MSRWEGSSGYDEHSLRTGSSLAASIAMVVLATLIAADAIARGDVGLVKIVVPVAGVVVWGYWALLGRPRVAFGDEGATVVGVLRVTTIPWAEVADIGTRYQLSFVLRSGRVIRSWGGPSVQRQPRRRQGRDSGTDGVDVLLEQWSERRGTTGGEVVRSRWDRPPLIVGAAIAIVAVTVVLLPL